MKENAENDFAAFDRAPNEPVESAAADVPGNEYVILFALWLLVFSASSQILMIVAMLPEFGTQLAIPEANRGTLVSGYALLVGIFALVIGPISDKFGRRKILLAGAGLMTFALALHASAFDFWSLLGVRALAGIAGGILSGAAVSYVGDYFPYERRGWANGWVMSGIAVGQIAGVPLGTYLAANHGFRAPFLLFAATMAATFALVYFFVPQPAVQLNENRLSARNALVEYWKLLKRGDVLAAAAAFFLMFFSMALYVTYLPSWLTAARDATANDIAALFLVSGVASVFAGPFAGRLSDAAGRKRLILASSIGFAALVGAATFLVREFWVAYPLFFAAAVLLSARQSPFQALLTALVGGAQRGTLMSLTVSLGQIGFAIGASIAGLGYVRYGYESNTFASAAAAILMALLVWRVVPEPAISK